MFLSNKEGEEKDLKLGSTNWRRLLSTGQDNECECKMEKDREISTWHPWTQLLGPLDWNSLKIAGEVLQKKSKKDSKSYLEDSDTYRRRQVCHAENELRTSNL